MRHKKASQHPETSDARALTTFRRYRSVAAATGLQVGAMVLGVVAGIVIARAGGPSVKGEATAFATTSVLVGTIAYLDLPQQALLVARRLNDSSAVVSILARAWATYVLLATLTILAGLWANSSLVVIVLGSLTYLVGSQMAVASNGVFSPVSSAISMFIQQIVMIFGAIALAVLGNLNNQTVRTLIIVSFLAPMPFLMSRLVRAGVRLTHPLLPSVGKGLLWQPARVLQYALMRADVLVVYLIFSPATAGIYSVALSTADLVGIAPTQFANMVLHRGSKDEGVNARTELVGSLTIATIFGLGLAAVGVWLIPWLYGDAFSSAYVLMLLCMPGAIAFGACQVLANRERMSGGPRRLTLSSGVGCAVMATAIVLSADSIGIRGVAIASSVGSLTALALLMLPSRESNSRPAGEI